VARKVAVYDRATRDGVWRWQSGAPIHRLRGTVLGLLSFGAIAKGIAARAAGFGMRITARGPIVDDRALHRALSEGWIAGAGLDDIEEEPAKIRGWRPDNPLFGLDNVVITPHAAYCSEEAIETVRVFAAEEVVRVLTGQPPLSPVNAADLPAGGRWSGARR
jgi:phosphoglycerate dehydrogenase-like enzyme